MDKLKGKTILIGKEPGNGRLLVSVSGNQQTAAIGQPNSVPNCVSRCKPVEGLGHVKITIDQRGNMILTNMKPQNVTYVNGTEVESKHVSPTNSIELGKDHFGISLPLVIETAKKIVAANAKPEAKSFDVSHLEQVWKRFHDSNLEIKKRQRHQGLQSRIPMFFTMGGGAISSVSFALGWGDEVKTLCVAMTVIGLLIMIYSFFKTKNDTSIEDSEKLLEEFQDKYVCPNPECNKFLGNMSYRLMMKQYSKQCPYCKCKFSE